MSVENSEVCGTYHRIKETSDGVVQCELGFTVLIIGVVVLIVLLALGIVLSAEPFVEAIDLPMMVQVEAGFASVPSVPWSICH